MALGSFLVVVVGLLAWIVAPIVREGLWESGGRLEEDPDELARKRDTALTALRDLEMDREMGRVEEVEYQRARREYQAEAAEAVQRLERLEAGS